MANKRSTPSLKVIRLKRQFTHNLIKKHSQVTTAEAHFSSPYPNHSLKKARKGA